MGMSVLTVVAEGLEGLDHFRVHAVEAADEVTSPCVFLVSRPDADVAAEFREGQRAQVGAGLGERGCDAAHTLQVAFLEGLLQFTDAGDGGVEVQLGELGDQISTLLSTQIEQRPHDEQIEDLLAFAEELNQAGFLIKTGYNKWEYRG